MLPPDWKVEIHDKNLLRAVQENGLKYLSKLKDNSEYGFSCINVPSKYLLRRVEILCFEFKTNLSRFKKDHDAATAGGDKSYG